MRELGFTSWRTLVAVCLVESCFFLPHSCFGGDAGVLILSEKDVDGLEKQAEVARNCFNSNAYDEAITILGKLSADTTISQPLYLNELGVCCLFATQYAKAKTAFLLAGRLMETFDPRSERKALSLFGAEAQKLYRGDPYERAINCLFLGLCFLRDNDVDNALACFKNGILFDSDAAADSYKSDFALIYCLEAFCYRLRGQDDLASQSAQQAEAALLTAHAMFRPFVFLDNVLTDGMSKNKDEEERKIMLGMRDELREKRKQLESRFDMRDIRKLADGHFNTLLLIGCGNAPKKLRYGQYGEKFNIVEPDRDDSIRFEITDENGNITDAARYVCDVTYQATTRGGRQMDNVLESKASIKKRADAMAGSLWNAQNYNNISDPRARLIAMGVGFVAGGISKVVSASTKAQADIRCWQLLPGEFQVVGINLKPGIHQLQVRAFRSYFPISEAKSVAVDISHDRALNFFVVAP